MLYWEYVSELGFVWFVQDLRPSNFISMFIPFNRYENIKNMDKSSGMTAQMCVCDLKIKT